MAAGPAAATGVVVPPYLMARQPTKFPAEIVARNAGRMVVVSAIIDAKGKVAEVRILQSPNPLLNEPLQRSLEECVFRPAQRNGEAVPVRILLGVPLGAAQ